MKLMKLGPNGCAGGACPTIYQSEDGRIYIQGYITKLADFEKLDMPKGETLVEVNKELVDFIRQNV